MSDQKPQLILPTKSLQEGAEAWLEGYGVELPRDDPDFDRVLVLDMPNERFGVMYQRPAEVPEVLAEENGTMGIGCSDGLLESGYADKITVVRRLGFGACKMMLLVPEGSAIERAEELEGEVIATSYPVASGVFFDQLGVTPSRIDVASGGIEARTSFPKTPAAAIIDLVQTGSSMRANRLRPIALVADTEAVLLENSDMMRGGNSDQIFNRFVRRDIWRSPAIEYPRDLPKGVEELDARLRMRTEAMELSSASRELLIRGVPRITEKIGEESFELLKALLVEGPEEIIEEAQTLVWLIAVGLRARGDSLGMAVAQTEIDLKIAKGENKQNDVTRVLGDSVGRFASELNRGNKAKVRKSAGRLLGAIENAVNQRGVEMREVFSKL